MELFVLISVNIVTAIIIYIIFAIRFSHAVKKARQNPVTRELRENIEVTIEYINTSLELFDQKLKSFYSLVRKSEEIAERLEKLNESAGSSKRKRSRKKSESGAEATGARESKSNPPEAAPLKNSPRAQKAEQSPEPEPSLARVLERQGEDRLEITPVADSTNTISADGELSRRYSSTSSAPIESGLASLLERGGKGIRRLMGVKEMQNNHGAGHSSLNESAVAGDSSSMEAAEKRSTRLPGDRGFSAVADDDMIAAAYRGEPSPNQSQAEPFMTSLTELQSDAELHLYKEEKEEKKPVLPSNHLSREDSDSTTIAEIINERGGVADLQNPVERKLIIQQLLATGFDKNEISQATGITLPEIELLANLPPVTGRKRRMRRVNG